MLFRREGNTLAPSTPAAEAWLQKQSGRVCIKHVTESEQRSLAQNALTWKWYGEIAEFIGYSVEDAHRYCKLHYGVPILRRDSDEFRKTYDKFLKPLMYEQKLVAVDIISVTSILSKKQMSEYCDTLYREWVSRGCPLTQPEEGETYGKRPNNKQGSSD